MHSTKRTSLRRCKMRAVHKAELFTVLQDNTEYVRNLNSDRLRHRGCAHLTCAALIAISSLAQAAEPPGARPSGVAGHVPAQNQQAQQAPVEPSRNAPAVRWWAPNEGVPLP